MVGFHEVPKLFQVKLFRQLSVVEYDDANVAIKGFEPEEVWDVFGFNVSRESMNAIDETTDHGRRVESSGSIYSGQDFHPNDGDEVELIGTPYGRYQIVGGPDDFNHGPFIQDFGALEWHIKRYGT